MSIKNNFVLAFIMLFLFACNLNQEAFVGTWNLKSLNIGGDVVNADEINNPVYTFNNNNTYEIAVSGIKETGTWKLEGDYLVLYNSENPDVGNKLKIIEASVNKFEFSSGEGDNSSVVLLIK